MSEERNYETEAVDLGWKPQEQFQGDTSKWVDAKTYVERADTVMPILKKSRDSLLGELTSVRTKVGELEGALAASTQTIKDLSEFHSAQIKEKVKETRERLIKQMTEARKNDDVEGEVRLNDELSQLNAAEAAAATRDGTTTTAKKEPVVDHDKAAREDPVFQGWLRENSWFGTDEDKTVLANAVSIKLRQKGDKSQGADFLNKVTAEVNRFYAGQSSTPGTTKVLGGGPTGQGGGGGGGGKGYVDLPSDAKAQCIKESAKFVGPNKMCKTDQEWQAYYAKQYFAVEHA